MTSFYKTGLFLGCSLLLLSCASPTISPSDDEGAIIAPSTLDLNDVDKDKDGLSAAEEQVLRTSDENPDSDGDGLTDFAEVRVHLTNPLNPDSDLDGMKDDDEVLVYQTNPNKPDSDDDGVSDGQEILDGTDPTNPADVDFDHDGVSALAECDDHNAGVGPNVPDTWGNGADVNCRPDVVECIASVGHDSGTYYAKLTLSATDFEPYTVIGYGNTTGMSASPVSCAGKVENLSGSVACSKWSGRGWYVEKLSPVRYRLHIKGVLTSGGTRESSCDVGD